MERVDRRGWPRPYSPSEFYWLQLNNGHLRIFLKYKLKIKRKIHNSAAEVTTIFKSQVYWIKTAANPPLLSTVLWFLTNTIGTELYGHLRSLQGIFIILPKMRQPLLKACYISFCSDFSLNESNSPWVTFHLVLLAALQCARLISWATFNGPHLSKRIPRKQ